MVTAPSFKKRNHQAAEICKGSKLLHTIDALLRRLTCRNRIKGVTVKEVEQLHSRCADQLSDECVDAFLQDAGGDGEQVLDPGHAIRHPGRVMIEQLSGHLALLGRVGLLCRVLQECFGKAVSDEPPPPWMKSFSMLRVALEAVPSSLGIPASAILEDGLQKIVAHCVRKRDFEMVVQIIVKADDATLADSSPTLCLARWPPGERRAVQTNAITKLVQKYLLAVRNFQCIADLLDSINRHAVLWETTTICDPMLKEALCTLWVLTHPDACPKKSIETAHRDAMDHGTYMFGPNASR